MQFAAGAAEEHRLPSLSGGLLGARRMHTIG